MTLRTVPIKPHEWSRDGSRKGCKTGSRTRHPAGPETGLIRITLSLRVRELLRSARRRHVQEPAADSPLSIYESAMASLSRPLLSGLHRTSYPLSPTSFFVEAFHRLRIIRDGVIHVCVSTGGTLESCSLFASRRAIAYARAIHGDAHPRTCASTRVPLIGVGGTPIWFRTKAGGCR